jgi:hypothetical protein
MLVLQRLQNHIRFRKIYFANDSQSLHLSER